MLHPEFPVIEGEYQMTKDWSVTLPEKFNRRFEDGSLVIWRPGFTIWAIVWNNNHIESKEARLATLQRETGKRAFDVQVVREKELLRFASRVNENAEDKRMAAFYGFAVGSDGHVQLGIYFDNENDVELAKKIWQSLRESPLPVKHN
jgi:hypothetical protein